MSIFRNLLKHAQFDSYPLFVMSAMSATFGSYYVGKLLLSSPDIQINKNSLSEIFDEKNSSAAHEHGKNYYEHIFRKNSRHHNFEISSTVNDFFGAKREHKC